MASASDSGGGDSPEPVSVAVAVRGSGRGSRRAARWAADNLVAGGGRVALVHVIPAVAFIPSPSGERVAVGKMGKEVVEMYVQDLKARAAQEVFFPYRRLCGRRNVETLVLEGDTVAAALARYAEDSGVRNFVLGSSSLSWIRRIIRQPDVPTTILKTIQSSCNIFIVSRRKIIMKCVNQPQISNSNTNVQIQSISHKAFSLIQRNCSFDKQTLHGFADNWTPKLSGQTRSVSWFQASSWCCASTHAGPSSESCFNGEGTKTPGREQCIKHDVESRSKEVPYVVLHSIKEFEPTDEVVKLRKELQNTLAMYDRACEDLVHAQKKIKILSSECSEESKKVEEALEREDMLKQVVAEEKAKHLETMKGIEQARKLFSREARSRNKAEIAATVVSPEKAKVLDALLSAGKSCKRYSKGEIERATDNFSDAKKIGEGSFGNVYRCILDHTEVAIKVIRQDSDDKCDEFLREVEILGQLHHPNLVLLFGFCPENGCLVYEYMENGSLEDQLFNDKGKQRLHWFVRFRIIYEVACGLAFLHGTKPEPIVHRDLKPGNILLDKNYVSKIGDVGLARLLSDLVPDGLTEYKETILAGTFHYMDPEYQLTGTLRPKSDLFALGVVILQLLTGKRPSGLITSVEDAMKSSSFSDILDESLTDWPVLEAEMLAKLALKCTSLRCRDRPDLESEVLPQLEELLNRASVFLKSRSPNAGAPSHFLCPILQEIMDDPYVAADGHTYEHKAIKAWLRKHKMSPVTKRRLPHSSVIPNHSLRAAIQQWKSQTAKTKA